MRDCDADLKAYDRKAIALSIPATRELRLRRDRVRGQIKRRLASFGYRQPIGFHSQGSIAMGTIVRDAESGYDIDDGVYFARQALVGPYGGEMSAYAARQLMLEAAYAEYYWDPPEMLKNCIRVYYAKGFHIDIPVYRVTRRGLASSITELASSDWKRSDPRAVTRWFRAANARSASIFNGGQLARIVRYTKAWARARPAWHGRILGGFGITKLVADCYRPSLGRGDRALYETLRAIQARLHIEPRVAHPVLQDEWIGAAYDHAKVRYYRSQLDAALARLAPLPLTRRADDVLAHFGTSSFGQIFLYGARLARRSS